MSVLEQFEHQATNFPDAVAVRLKGQYQTYSQLNAQSELIAAALQSAGVGPETLVGVFLERTAQMVGSLIGIWKAGGAFLSLDYSLPSQRLAFMLEDSDVQYILTQRSLLSILPANRARVICIEDVLTSRYSSPVDNGLTRNRPSPEQLAYVIFTSGSTGRPKGVELCHGGLASVIQALNAELNLTDTDVVLAITTTAFDISNLEFFLPLTQGGCAYLVGQECARDGARLASVLEESKATLMLGTPTLWHMLLEAGWRGNPNLQVISGGEALPLSLGKTLAGISKAVWNHYGPSETTICASTEKIEQDAEKVTIGAPLAGAYFYILDSTLQPVLLGDVGEIYIGGAGVGRGYIKRDDLNRVAFLPDPFRPGFRIYKTGDLGKELPNGTFEFVGRVDEQVKIRGFRIELKEIEEAIREFPGVHSVSVQAIEVSFGDQRLVAYVQQDSSFDRTALREFLRSKLPSYMVPAEYVEIDSLPMTSSGKVDRAALRLLRVEPISTARTIMEPRNEMEAGMKAIWEKTLKISPIGVQDNFFELGGHSFLAAKLFSEMERKLGLQVPLSMLMEHPTIETLAQCIREQETKQEWPGVVTIQSKGNQPPLFFAHGLGGSLLIFKALAEKLGVEQPIYGLQLVSGMVEHKNRLSIPELASIYIEEMRAVRPSGPYNIAGHSLGGLIAYEIASQLARQGEEIGVLALFDCDLRFSSTLPNGQPAATLRDKIRSNLQQSASILRRAAGPKRNELIQRKIFYQKLKIQISLLKRFPKIGETFPRLFGDEVYVAISTEQYHPEPYPGDAVVFIAADQPRANRNFGSGWLNVVLGNCDLLRIAGTHQSIFASPHVDQLAQELGRRLHQVYALRAQKSRPALTGS